MGFDLRNKVLQLNSISIVGRSYKEYIGMFDLTDLNLKENKILDVGSGVGSFVSEARKKKFDVYGSDIIYKNPIWKITYKCYFSIERVAKQLEKKKDNFVWFPYKDPNDCRKQRKNNFSIFLKHYLIENSRYYKFGLPKLNFPDNSFDITLVGYLLFSYDDRLNFEFHIESIIELLRISKKEVRIHPLINLFNEESDFVSKIVQHEKLKSYTFEIRKVNYIWFKDGNKTLIIKK